MIRDTDSKRQISSSVAVEQGQTVTGEFEVECETGYALSGSAVSDLTCEYKHSAAGSWTPATTPISLTPWSGTTQTFDFRFTAPASAINYRRSLPLTVGKSTTSSDRSVSLDAGALSLTGQNLTLTNRREILTLGLLNVTGQDVTFTYDQPNETLAIDAGALTLTGQSVDLQRDLLFGLDAGSVSTTGQNVTLTYDTGGDADVAAFITATGIADSTIEAALEALVASLKADGIWTKCHAIYPFVGGTASTHKYNLKDPQDTNGAFRITWVNTPTQNANGVTGNGSSSYGNTNYNLSTSGAINNCHIGVYSRTASNGSHYDMGASDGSSGHVYMAARSSDFGGVAWANCGDNKFVSGTSDGSGFILVSRRGGSDLELYRNGSSIGTNVNASSGVAPNYNIFVCAVNTSGSAGLASPKNLAFATIGEGLTDTEAANYHTAVEAFQDALSRGVA